ncbi:MAG: sugar phosphate nucleotidyltransferase [Cyanobacteriota bacterium]|nr:sugar phosphate nucleotidyltransferase [Cyanobacteriota bacterium]
MDSPRLRKAIVPAAGFGTRLFPATQVVKKELLPIVDAEGRAKPAIVAIVEEAINGGIEEVGIVIQPGDRGIFEALFKAPPKPQLWQKLKPHQHEYSQYLQEMGKRVVLLEQTTQDGYGHAVYCARDWVGDEPFMLLLGDHIYASKTEISCAGQMRQVYERTGRSAIGLRVMPGNTIHLSGCATGTWQDAATLSLTKIAEKPSLEYARQHLRVEGLGEDEFLTMFGIYVLEARIFEYLEQHIAENFREGGEFQLTSCLEKLCRDVGAVGYIVRGQCFDFGIPETYRQTAIDFGAH